MSDSVGGYRPQSQVTGARQNPLRDQITSSSEMCVNERSAEISVIYSDRKSSSMYNGSEEYFEYSCDPCNTAGDHVEAHGFCINCHDYLCGACLKSHYMNKASRNHALLDKDDMPKITVKFCDPCNTAGEEEEAAGYCTDFHEYLCINCFRSHSRNKASRQHMLLDKVKMQESTDNTLIHPVAKINIYTPDADSQKYNEEYTYIRDINVKTEKDEKDCYILGMTLVSSTELVLADYNNISLKLVDPVNNVIKDSLRLETFLDGLTTIFQDQVAVVLENKCKIQIISVCGLSVVRNLNTKGTCVDVKCINGKLYVSFDEPIKFQIIQLTGALFKTINPKSEVIKRCTLPGYIAVSPDERMIFISDWKTNRVMCIVMNGNMISMFQSELGKPHDITTSPFGSVYLCDREQALVYKMTSDLSEAAVILGRGDGLMSPQAMCFDTDKRQLYISSGNVKAKYKMYYNFLKVCKWNYVIKADY